MNIIIPACGLGKRFEENGYYLPKPFIKVLGESMIIKVIKSLKLSEEDNIIIAYKKEMYNFENIINHNINKKIIGIPVDFDTRGAVETVLCALNNIENDLYNDNVVILDCDTFYEQDIISFYKDSKCKNAIACFFEKSGSSVFSFVSINDDNSVNDIAEKNRISNFACSGFYAFESMNLLKKLCNDIIHNNIKTNNEFYISLLYKELIKSSCVTAIKVENPICIGTPFQLKSYCSNRPIDFDYRVCFDLDNTLVSFPEKTGDYSTVKPIEKNIKYLRFLKEMGCKIIIYTARKMKTAKNDVSLATELAKDQVFKTIEDFKIPYDELYFGKPYAHVYIDDLAANAMIDLEKQIGIYNTAEETRKFNNIIFQGDSVIKKSPDAVYQAYYYRNIPNSLSDLFPKIISSEQNSLIIEKINGITMSNLYVNKTLLIEQFEKVLHSIDRLHSFKCEENISIYDNYAKKIKDRYEKYDYSKFKNSDNIYKLIMDFSVNYEKDKKGEISIIHGDPVFSNVLLSSDNIIKFIDMRGKVGNSFTIYGDKFYDYAKIFQSIIGYELVMNDAKINNYYTDKFYDYFKLYINNKFGVQKFYDIKMITVGLLFSLIPIHDNDKCKGYYELIDFVLNK